MTEAKKIIEKPEVKEAIEYQKNYAIIEDLYINA